MILNPQVSILKSARGPSRSGQAMIITILTIGGAILGATTLAGLLTLYDIRSSTDSINSAKAIFAADAGVNWALESYFQPSSAGASPVLTDGATILVNCYDSDGGGTPCNGSGATPPVTAVSKGESLNSSRAFLLNLTEATTSLP